MREVCTFTCVRTDGNLIVIWRASDDLPSRSSTGVFYRSVKVSENV